MTEKRKLYWVWDKLLLPKPGQFLGWPQGDCNPVNVPETYSIYLQNDPQRLLTKSDNCFFKITFNENSFKVESNYCDFNIHAENCSPANTTFGYSISNSGKYKLSVNETVKCDLVIDPNLPWIYFGYLTLPEPEKTLLENAPLLIGRIPKFLPEDINLELKKEIKHVSGLDLPPTYIRSLPGQDNHDVLSRLVSRKHLVIWPREPGKYRFVRMGSAATYWRNEQEPGFREIVSKEENDINENGEVWTGMQGFYLKSFYDQESTPDNPDSVELQQTGIIPDPPEEDDIRFLGWIFDSDEPTKTFGLVKNCLEIIDDRTENACFEVCFLHKKPHFKQFKNSPVKMVQLESDANKPDMNGTIYMSINEKIVQLQFVRLENNRWCLSVSPPLLKPRPKDDSAILYDDL